MIVHSQVGDRIAFEFKGEAFSIAEPFGSVEVPDEAWKFIAQMGVRVGIEPVVSTRVELDMDAPAGDSAIKNKKK